MEKKLVVMWIIAFAIIIGLFAWAHAADAPKIPAATEQAAKPDKEKLTLTVQVLAERMEKLLAQYTITQRDFLAARKQLQDLEAAEKAEKKGAKK